MIISKNQTPKLNQGSGRLHPPPLSQIWEYIYSMVFLPHFTLVCPNLNYLLHRPPPTVDEETWCDPVVGLVNLNFACKFWIVGAVYRSSIAAHAMLVSFEVRCIHNSVLFGPIQFQIWHTMYDNSAWYKLIIIVVVVCQIVFHITNKERERERVR